jgi:hypothetical protein
LRGIVLALVSVGCCVAFAGCGKTGSGQVRSASSASAACTVTIAPGMPAGSLADAIVGASDNTTVCLSSGHYPFIHFSGAKHGGYVTVRPAPGAQVDIAGMEVSDSSFLRFEGLRSSAGFNMRDKGDSASHDYQFLDNTFEAPLYGIVLDGGSGPVKKVLIEGNHIRDVHLEAPEVAGKCSAGYAQGQDITLYNAEGVTISHNVFDQAAWHYIQGGGAGPEGVDVEHNLFEGHIAMACSHLNIWQIWAGGENNTFRGNVTIGRGLGVSNGLSEEAATDGILFENGEGSTECGVKMKNTVIEDNLFVDAATSYELQVYTTEGATIAHNTVVGSQWGTALLPTACGAGKDYTMANNIDVEDQGAGADFHFGSCTGTCLFDENVSQDASASGYGSERHVSGWSPKWVTTTWGTSAGQPPKGFYVPVGLPFDAGYRGTIGP